MPAIPASAVGVLKTRSRPNSRWSPSVTRNTPPSSPTSSPNTSVRGSAESAPRSAAFRAPAIVTSAITEHLLALASHGRRRVGEGEVEQLGVRRRSERGDAGTNLGDPRLRLGSAARREGLVSEGPIHQVPAQSLDRVALAPGGHLRLVAVPR